MKKSEQWERIESYLYQRKYQTSKKEWTTRYFARFKDWKGINRKKPLGTNLKAARQKLQMLLGDNVRGVDLDKEKSERMTFDRWADRYLELAAGKRTIKDDISLLKFLRVEFGP